MSDCEFCERPEQLCECWQPIANEFGQCRYCDKKAAAKINEVPFCVDHTDEAVFGVLAPLAQGLAVLPPNPEMDEPEAS